MEVFIITRMNGHYYGSTEIYKVVGSEEEAESIIKEHPRYSYESHEVESTQCKVIDIRGSGIDCFFGTYSECRDHIKDSSWQLSLRIESLE